MISRPKYGHKSQESAFNGVMIYLSTYYPSLMPSKEAFQQFQQCNKVMICFLKSIEINHKTGGTEKVRRYNSNQVQNNWKAFVEFLNHSQK